jgi:hypothetical protein
MKNDVPMFQANLPLKDKNFKTSYCWFFHSTQPLCCSIASFTQTLLLMNLKIPSNKWMNSPLSTTLHSVTDMPDSILLHQINNIPTSALTKVTKKIPPVYQVLFLEDLKKSQFPGWTFAWDQPWFLVGSLHGINPGNFNCLLNSSLNTGGMCSMQ